MTNKAKLLASNEVVGALVTNELSASDAKAFADNPQNVIATHFDLDVYHIDFNVVQNSDSDVNLVLPYYEAIDEMHSSALKDESLSNISGGEIFLTIGTLCGMGIAIGVGTAIAGAGAVGAGTLIAGGIIGAAVGAGVIGTAVGVGLTESRKAQNAKLRAEGVELREGAK